MATNAMSKATSKIRRPTNASKLPEVPGMYYWTEWDCIIKIYSKPRCKGLYVTPPGASAVEVKITPFIAGKFTLQEAL